MSQDITPVMQAAERLRLARVVESMRPEIPVKYEGRADDIVALADFALSILPKGERPVAITEGQGFAPYIDPMSCEVIDNARFTAGQLETSSKYYPDDWDAEDPRWMTVVASKRDALVELQHQWLEMLTNRIASLAREIDSEPAPFAS